MAAQKPSVFRIWLPVLVPMLVNFIGTAWVLVAARRSINVGACDISLPWAEETSYLILARFFPAALEEAETFGTVVSRCIADLHADITSAYIIVLMFAVVSGFFALKFTRYPQAPWHTEEHTRYLKGMIASFLIAAIGLAIFFLTTVVSGFIDFTGNVRKMIHVVDGYVSLLSYWLAIQGLGFTLSASLWCFYYGFDLLSALIKKK